MRKADKFVKKNQISLIILVFGLIAVASILGAGITGFFGLMSLSSGNLVYLNGSVATVLFDNYSQKYVDNSVTNTNIYSKLCSNDPSVDLLNDFISYYIVVGNNSLELGVMPAQMVSSRISSGCAFVDVDFSLYKSFFPAIISYGVDSNQNMSNVSFYNLTNTTGFLKGNFLIDPVNETVINVTVNVRYPLTDQNNTYHYKNKSLIVGIRNSLYEVVDSEITFLDTPVTLDRPIGSYIITINNIDNPYIFRPIVTIIIPSHGELYVKNSDVLIDVDAIGNITHMTLNVSWDSDSRLLNAVYNSTSGKWESLFTETSFVGRYNVSATGYDVNGENGTDTSYFFTTTYVPAPGGSGGGSKLGYSNSTCKGFSCRRVIQTPEFDFPVIEMPKYEQPLPDLTVRPKPKLHYPTRVYPILVRFVKEVEGMPRYLALFALALLGVLAYFMLKESKSRRKRKRKRSRKSK